MIEIKAHKHINLPNQNLQNLEKRRKDQTTLNVILADIQFKGITKKQTLYVQKLFALLRLNTINNSVKQKPTNTN